MSHFKERKEKNCLNCNTEVAGRYCQSCGQENIEPKESFWHIITHLVAHEFHFDSKFFSTVHHLLLKPGFLTKEYIKGKRVSYLDPIRMYIFCSAIFFLVYFSLHKDKHLKEIQPSTETKKEAAIEKLSEKTEVLKDSLKYESFPKPIKEGLANSLSQNEKLIGKLKDEHIGIDTLLSTTDSVLRLIGKKQHKGFVQIGDRTYDSEREYDSVQSRLPTSQRDNALVKWLTKMSLNKSDRYKDSDELWASIVEEMAHSFSELLFVSLPFFALILQLLYIKHRSRFYYVEHFLFSIHLYCGIFLLLLVSILFDQLIEHTKISGLRYIQAGLFFAGGYYCYKSLRNFYGQSRRKTIFKFITLNLLAGILFAFLLAIFLLLSALKA